MFSSGVTAIIYATGGPSMIGAYYKPYSPESKRSGFGEILYKPRREFTEIPKGYEEEMQKRQNFNDKYWGKYKELEAGIKISLAESKADPSINPLTYKFLELGSEVDLLEDFVIFLEKEFSVEVSAGPKAELVEKRKLLKKLEAETKAAIAAEVKAKV
jgi:hypothetical protein